jgi:hypothetical protein
MRSTISSVSLGKASSGRKSGTFHALEWLFPWPGFPSPVMGRGLHAGGVPLS